MKHGSENRSLWPLIRLTGSFALFFLVMQWGYQAASGTVIEHILIDEATVKPSAALINQLAPNARVRSHGAQLTSPNIRLSILNGCEGMESLFLMIAAILAYRCRWKDKLIGLTLGTLLIYGLNQLRIVGLYFALRQDQGLFAAIHGYIGPTLIIAIGVLFFTWWTQWTMRTAPGAS